MVTDNLCMQVYEFMNILDLDNKYLCTELPDTEVNRIRIYHDNQVL